MRAGREVIGVPSDYGLRVATTTGPNGEWTLLGVLEFEMNDGTLAWVVESSDVLPDGELVDTVFSDRDRLDEFLESARPTWLPDSLRVLEMYERRFSGRIRYRKRRPLNGVPGSAPAADGAGLLWVNARAWAQSRWRLASGRHGEFARGERSARSMGLDALWDSLWFEDVPIGYVLRSSHERRSLRIHSLPGGKRYADTLDEYDEIVRRHRIVLADILGNADLSMLIVLAADYDRHDLAAGWVKRLIPDAWPWRRFAGDEDEDGASSYIWVQSGLTDQHLDSLLRAVADDEIRFVLTDSHMRWLYCPYDGGADVIFLNEEERERVAARYADWMPRN